MTIQHRRGEIDLVVTDLSFHRATGAVVECQNEFTS